MGRRMNVLVVNHDALVCELLSEALRPWHDVRVAHGLREAIEELAQAVPDVIVCELDLWPFCGAVLLELIAREHPDVRRVLCVERVAADDGYEEIAHDTVPRRASLDRLLAAIGGTD
jgi:DNA-binding NtrC family response regulator